MCLCAKYLFGLLEQRFGKGGAIRKSMISYEIRQDITWFEQPLRICICAGVRIALVST